MLGYFRPWVPETSGLWVSEAVMGFEGHHGVSIAAWGLTRIRVRHGVRNASWGSKYTMGWEMRQGEGIKEGVCV